ncbi:hypothetical protein CMV_000405 [Castanea mollissima]|uniref:Uncharacterized protein n=1 Tax=Castanea mollissima TaxID=60419 RepID=A0A8J4S3R1_9ROSI|nr:hypothetical protein CMV_000405 [Castanea mollissima]
MGGWEQAPLSEDALDEFRPRREIEEESQRLGGYSAYYSLQRIGLGHLLNSSKCYSSEAVAAKKAREKLNNS